MLNWKLMSHPINWVTVLLMVFIGVMVTNLLLTPWHSAQAASSKMTATNS